MWHVLPSFAFFSFFFFFQAEDGIRDLTVTGVQTCALPISGRRWRLRRLEITVAEDASDVQLAHVRAEFAWLAEQGPAVAIARAARCEATRDLVSGRNGSERVAFGGSCAGRAAAGEAGAANVEALGSHRASRCE